jgi:hypothetical protein
VKEFVGDILLSYVTFSQLQTNANGLAEIAPEYVGADFKLGAMTNAINTAIKAMRSFIETSIY